MSSVFCFHTVDGLRLAGEDLGPRDAPTVILLHGGGQTRRSWGTAACVLAARGYRTVSYDARGHGESDWATDADYSFEALARDLASLLEKLPRPVALVGASMGGITAFRVSASSVADINALVLVDIVPTPSRSGGERIIAFMTQHTDGFATVEEAADAVSAYYPERARPADTSGLARNLRQHGDGRYYWHWDPRLLADGLPDFAGWAVEMAPQVGCPTLLVRGGRSDVVDDAGVEQLQDLIPQTEVINIAGAGHMIVGDSNDAFNQGMISFIDRHMPAV